MADKGGYIGRSPGDSAVIIARQNYSPTGVQTDFTFNSGYTPGYVDVYINGVRLIDVQDYVASTGNTVGLTSYANSGDIVEVIAYKAFNVGNVENATGNFDVGGNLTVSGDTNVSGQTTTKNLHVTGVSTLTGASYLADVTEFVSSGIVTVSNTTDSTSTTTGALLVNGGVGVALSMHVGGNLSVGGTLTYEDVTNVDAIGIVTAQSGVNIVGGGLTVTGVGTFFSNIDANGTLDVSGESTLATVSITDYIYHAGDSNTMIRFPAADTFTVETGGSERLRIDSSGRLLVGSTSNNGVWGVNAALQVEGTTYHTSAINVIRNTNDTGGALLTFAKSRATSDGGTTIVQSGDVVGSITWAAADGVDVDTSAAQIAVEVDGTPGSNDMPGRIVFKTTADGAAGVTERLRITSAGNLGINESSPGHKLVVGGDGYFGFTSPNDAARQIIFNSNRGSAADTLANINWQWNSKNVAQIRGIAGADTTNKDDGHLSFFTSAANSLVERLRITSAGNVGIGSAIPTDILDIQTGSSDEVTKFKVRTSGRVEITRNHSDSPYIKTVMSSGNPAIHLGDTGGDKTVIHGHGTSYFNGGNVGIGSEVPTGKLDVATGGNAYINLGQDSDNPKVVMFRSTGSAPNTHYGAELQFLTGDFAFSNAAGAALGSHSFTERLRITAGGVVVVGHTAASSSGATNNSSFNIVGNIGSATGEGQLNLWKRTAPSADNVLGQINFCGDTTGDPGAVIKGEADLAWDQGGDTSDHAGRLTFFTVPDNSSVAAERLRIDSSGSLLIGSTSNNGASNSGQTPVLYANGYSNLGGLRVKGGDDGNTIYKDGGDLCLVTASAHSIILKANGNDRLSISSAGNVLVSGTFQVNNFQILDGGWTTNWDTGISVNQSNAGACLIFMNCSNWDANDSTAAGIYIVRLGYSGNQDPQVWHISGNNSWTITKSGSNTVLISNASGNQRSAILWTT